MSDGQTLAGSVDAPTRASAQSSVAQAPMRVLFLADAGSPIAQSWIGQVVGAGHEVHVVSSYPAEASAIPGIASFSVIPVAFSGMSRPLEASRAASSGESAAKRSIRAIRRAIPLNALASVRALLAPADVLRQAPLFRRHVRAIRPDLVHAMRIPYEGLLAAEALRNEQTPLVLSIWGNDFTLHASGSRVFSFMTRRAVTRANALHADCARDLRLAAQWGFAASKPSLVMPGNGGLDLDVFCPGPPETPIRETLGIPADAPVIVNPRGIRTYVRSDVFLRAIPRVLAVSPGTMFVGVGMAGDAKSEALAGELGVRDAVRLTPPLPREQVRDLFRIAVASVSPSLHDGTPNTLLEAMACGALPIAGDIESVREWIEDGKNGLLVDPTDHEALAVAMNRALYDLTFASTAANLNRDMVRLRANASNATSDTSGLYRAACVQ
jgi:glycosyltransferase involved in cell wall biosynthesis